MQPIDKPATIQPTEQQSAFVDVRGPSGRLYGRIDPATLVLEVKYRNQEPEKIDLRKLLIRPAD